MSHESEEGWSPQGPVLELSDQASWELMASKNFGHLAVSSGAHPDIYPVNYYTDGTTILFRTAAGSKLEQLTENGHVAFEVDAETPTSVWSTVAVGPATVIDPTAVASEALAAFPPWVPTSPYVFVSIAVRSIRGRLFERHHVAGSH